MCSSGRSAWFADHGVTVERVLSDNGSAYRSYAWRDACADLGITPKRTRPYRPQTNGKIERFHRTLADGWAYARLYESTEQRNAALPGWLHFYNHHRAHSAIGGQATRQPTDQRPWTSQLGGQGVAVAARHPQTVGHESRRAAQPLLRRDS